MRGTIEGRRLGQAHTAAIMRARRDDRIAELEFLIEQGEPIATAAVRAGWPTIDAARQALQRARHPKARPACTAAWRDRQAVLRSARRALTCGNTSP